MKFRHSVFAHPAFFWIVASLVALGALGGAGFYGYTLGTEQPKTILVKGVSNLENDPSVKADFGTFWQAWKLLRDEHLKGASLEEKNLVYGAIDGLVDSLDDPNTVFFPPEDGKKFEEDVRGNFGGIGAEIGIRNDQLVIIAPLKDSPAEKAGIKSGDKIIKIDGEPTDDIKVNDAVKKIRGEIGTKVTLTIHRADWEKTKDFVITRGQIVVPTIEHKMLEGEVAYIRVRSFNENAPQMFFEAAKELLGKGINGVILDVRDDPGGFLEVAVDIAGWFMPKGSVVAVQEFRDPSQKRTFKTVGPGFMGQVPIVVLINQGSASASEILAGALRDNLNAKLVGEKTFGKGTVQELKRLRDGSSIKLTISHWLLPKGDLIEKNGIKPDYEVKISEEDAKAGKDPQLEKAQQIIKGLIEKFLNDKTAAVAE
jgi:carboxyl-terminal processing protease